MEDHIDDAGTALRVEPLNAVQSLTAAEIDRQIETAKKFPRNEVRALKQAEELATMTPEIAEDCLFAITRGGKLLEGPSIRLAEILAYSWTNLRCAGRTLEVGDGEIVAQGICLDLERNLAWSKEVRRGIRYSGKGPRAGERYSEDMIGVTANAGISIACRNAIFAAIPAALWAPIYQAAIRAVGRSQRPLSDRRAAAVQWFQGRGVSQEELLRFLHLRRVEDIGPDVLARLAGLRNAIVEESATVDSIFRETPVVAQGEVVVEPERQDAGQETGVEAERKERKVRKDKGIPRIKSRPEEEAPPPREPGSDEPGEELPLPFAPQAVGDPNEVEEPQELRGPSRQDPRVLTYGELWDEWQRLRAAKRDGAPILGGVVLRKLLDQIGESIVTATIPYEKLHQAVELGQKIVAGLRV